MVTKNDFVYVKSLFVFGQFSNIKSTIVKRLCFPSPRTSHASYPHYTGLSSCELEMHTENDFILVKYLCVSVYIYIYIYMRNMGVSQNMGVMKWT